MDLLGDSKLVFHFERFLRVGCQVPARVRHVGEERIHGGRAEWLLLACAAVAEGVFDGY